MKKIKLLPIVVLLLISSSSLSAHDRARPVTSDSALAAVDREISSLKNRVAEIKAIDKSSLTRTERRQLRTELRIMKKDLEQKTQGRNGVYISTGLIIVVLLLIILL